MLRAQVPPAPLSRAPLSRAPLSLVPLLLVLAVVLGGCAAPPADTGSHSAAASTSSQAERLTARTCSGAKLADEATVAAGQLVVLTLTGFAPSAAVQVRLVGRPVASAPAPADQFGTLRIAYQVPADASRGAHLLTLSGAAPVSSPAGPAGVRSAGGQNLTVTVPNTGLFHFVVAGSAVDPNIHRDGDDHVCSTRAQLVQG